MTTPETDHMELNAEAQNLVAVHRRADEEIKRWSDVRDQTKALLVEALGNHTMGTIGREPVVTRTVVTQRRLNQKLLKEQCPDVYERHLTTSSYVKLTVAKAAQS